MTRECTTCPDNRRAEYRGSRTEWRDSGGGVVKLFVKYKTFYNFNTIRRITSSHLRARPLQCPGQVGALYVVTVRPLAPCIRVVELER